MAVERNFWQVLILGTKTEAGLYMRVLEYPTRELAEETFAAVEAADEHLQYTSLKAVRLYPIE